MRSKRESSNNIAQELLESFFAQKFTDGNWYELDVDLLVDCLNVCFFGRGKYYDSTVFALLISVTNSATVTEHHTGTEIEKLVNIKDKLTEIQNIIQQGG